MCGFVGIISKNGKGFDESTLKRMNSMIVHRGPDDEGYFSHEDWLNLAFRRLSILDLSAKGHQPMLSADGNLAIVFNGEIYNYRELREGLKISGHTFISGSDTEVILAAYREWGEKCVDKFIGMFAFMLADLREKSVFIARDPLGIKPLFFFEDADNYIFCSEVKCLLPYCQLQPDSESINEYLIFRSLPGSNTMFKGVENVPQGSFFRYANGKLTSQEYFNLADTIHIDHSRSFEEVCDEVEKTFIESVKIHLRSDVELGVQLSGGVDSSLITAIAANESHKKFHSFSISFANDLFDESEYQKRVSERYGTEHHDYPMNEELFMGLFEPSIWHYEHPLNDPNAVCTYHLVNEAKKYITVMLSGEGADEAFLGYTRFLRESLARVGKRTWLYRHSGLRELLYRIWPIAKGKQLFNVTRYHPALYALSYANLNYTDLLLKGNDEGRFAFRQKMIAEADGSVLNEAMLQDQACDLMQWFWRADRIGMAGSMELRVPFCTAKMFKLANSIPYSQRVYGGERKAVLKKIAEKYIDHDQIYRKKIGFGTPIDDWLQQDGPYAGLFEETMESKRFKEREFIDHEHFNMLYNAHKDGSYREHNSAYLWTYFNFELWYRIFFEDGWKQLTG
jgi:asparagine synthase (glutamine-hydrolysing)